MNRHLTWTTMIAIALLIGFMNLGSAEAESRDIVIGERVSFFSETLAETRTVLIATPDGYDESTDEYPVLFVLDGATHFHHTTALSKSLASNQIMPAMLVVGIENTVRIRDLTPPAEDPQMAVLEPEHGGSANFRSFISNELMPWLDENYRTHSFTVLIGHSLGGLFAIDSLIENPTLFDAYIAISPSLHWDEGRIIGRARPRLGAAQHSGAILYMTAGNEGGPLLASTRHFAAVLDADAPEGLTWQFDHMPSESHGSVPLRSIHNGLEFIYSGWNLRDPIQVHSDFGLEAIERFYEASDALYGFDRGVPESTVVSIARHLLDTGQITELRAIQQHYASLVVPPPGFLERRANQMREDGDTDNAVLLYEMALDIYPDSEDARDALVELANE